MDDTINTDILISDELNSNIVTDTVVDETIISDYSSTDDIYDDSLKLVPTSTILDVKFNGESVVDNKIATIPNELSKYNNDNNYVIHEEYDSYLSFPNIGNKDTFYIDTTADITYRWDNVKLKYFKIGSDWHEIELISGGNA